MLLAEHSQAWTKIDNVNAVLLYQGAALSPTQVQTLMADWEKLNLPRDGESGDAASPGTLSASAFLARAATYLTPEQAASVARVIEADIISRKMNAWLQDQRDRYLKQRESGK